MDKTNLVDDRYRLIVDAIGIGVWDWNTLTGEAYFNEGYYKVLGYENNAFPSNYETWVKLIHPEDVRRVEEEIQKSVASGEKFDIELRMKTQMGTWLWVLTSGKVIEKNSEGKAVRMVGTFTDIGARKAAEENLRLISDRLSLAVKAGGVGIWDWDVPNNKMVWDNQMYNLYGIKEEDFSGAYDAWQNGLHPDDKSRGYDEVQKALKGEADFNTEFRVVWPDGTIHNIRGIGLVQRDAEGKPIRMIGTNWEITKVKEAEEKYKEKIDELAKLNALMVGREVKMVEMKKELDRLKAGGS